MKELTDQKRVFWLALIAWLIMMLMIWLWFDNRIHTLDKKIESTETQ